MSYSLTSGVMSKQFIKSGDPIVIFLLSKSKKHSFYSNVATSNYTTVEGAEILYKPISLPIFAEYHEYNKIKNIKKTESVIDLENKLEMSIEDFLKETVEQNYSISKDIIDNIFICFEHLSVYNDMIELDKKKRPKSDINFNLHIIEKLGFENNSNKYFEPSFFHKNNDFKIDFISPSFSTFYFKDKRSYVDDLIHLNIYSCLEGETVASSSFLNAKKEYNLLIDYLKSENLLKDYIECNNSKKDLDLFYFKVKSNLNEKEIDFFESLVHNVDFYIEYISNELHIKNIFELKEEDVISMFHFLHCMNKTNTIFIPMMSSYDDTEESYCIELLDISKKVAH